MKQICELNTRKSSSYY